MSRKLTASERQRLQRELLLRVSKGWTKTDACRRLGITPRTVTRWALDDAEFAAKHRAARIEQAHSLADRALRVARRPVERGDTAAVQRNRLIVDTIKWFASKIAPRLYGERVDVEARVTGGVIILPPLDPVANIATLTRGLGSSRSLSSISSPDIVSSTRARARDDGRATDPG